MWHAWENSQIWWERDLSEYHGIDERMGSELILGDWLGGVDSVGSGYGLVQAFVNMVINLQVLALLS
jgi:hypothetical protein